MIMTLDDLLERLAIHAVLDGDVPHAKRIKGLTTVDVANLIFTATAEDRGVGGLRKTAGWRTGHTNKPSANSHLHQGKIR